MVALHSFLAFGLVLRSDQLLPGLVACARASRTDVEVRFGEAPPLLRAVPPPQAEAFYVCPLREAGGEPALVAWQVGADQDFRLRYADGTDFLVARSGARVWALWPAPLTLDDVATYLLGPILGLLLRLRGLVCLHASAVVLDNQAVAFVGPAGAGKSTLAAAFACRGIPVLADDLVPLDDEGPVFQVPPGPPRLRLWPQAAQLLFGAADALPPLTPNWDKRCLDLEARGFPLPDAPLPLGAIYLLSERVEEPRAPYVEPLRLREGLLGLIANTSVNYLLDGALRAREFQVLGELLRRVPLRRLVPHADPARLDALCRCVVADDQGRRAGAVRTASGPALAAGPVQRTGPSPELPS